MSRSTSDLDVSFVRDITACCFYFTRLNGNWSEARHTPLFWLQAHDRLTRRRWLKSKGVTIALTDRLLNKRIHSAEILELRGEGATLRVPLDGSMAALGRLEMCFEKNSRL